MLCYFEELEERLPRPDHGKRRDHIVLDLFAGCGGLALGFEAIGFDTLGYEMDADACSTYNRNLNGRCEQVFLEPGLDLVGKDEIVDVIIGGPPCQPFSVVGLQNGSIDKRDGFPVFLDAVRRYNPKVLVFENVRGMLYRNRMYFDKIVAELQLLNYAVSWQLLNAARYGVPQYRERLVVVGHRGGWLPPKPIHTAKSVTAGEALRELALEAPNDGRYLTKSMDEYIARYEAKSKCINPRDLHLHRPSRTVTCRNLYGATADMLRIRLADGRRRMLTVREAARLQSFPDWFEFSGTEAKQFHQIGNAVPPLLARAIAESVRDVLEQPPVSEREIKAFNQANTQLSLNL